MTSLSELLTKRNLREYGGTSIYSRGLTYYDGGRVLVKVADSQEAECVVRGTSYYTVRLWVHQDRDLGCTCNCPYAANGWFCKHIVAAGLATADHLQRFGGDLWKQRLDSLLQGAKKSTRAKTAQPYWLFLTLLRDTYHWKLIPHHLWIRQVPEGVLPSEKDLLAEELPDLISHNNWLMGYIKPGKQSYRSEGCVNGSLDEVAFVSLIMQQNRQAENFYNYQYSVNTNSIGNYLPVLANTNLPIFLGDKINPVRRHLKLMPDLQEVQLNLQRKETGLHLQLIPGKETNVNHDRNLRAELLTNEASPWILMGDQVFQLISEIDIDYLHPWLQNPTLDIPFEQEDRFLEEYFPEIAEKISISGEGIEWTEIRSAPTKRLYLTEEDDDLQVHLRFGYGSAEVNYEKGLPEVSVRRKPESWGLYQIYREPDLEEQAWSEVSSAHHGLKRSGAELGDHIFLLRARVDPIDFLMRHIPRLIQNGFEIYGEEKLKSARVNRHKPTLSLNVSSGIDWFDLQAIVKFGDIEATLKDVRKALKRKERYIKLADGTIGEIPDEWVERYKHLFGLSEETEDGLRFSNHHLTLLDQLLGEADRVQYDPEFQKRKRRLLSFEGIEPKELPSGFVGELRPYQKAGFDWLHFLHDYEFGGCLADDMGLGKTIETLAYLQSQKESGHVEKATLLVLPRSLLVNWQREAESFTPQLSCYEYFGNERTEDFHIFDQYDLILTTYGVMLRDIEALRAYRFHYVILDESQAIKNPLSKTSKAARLLNSDHRLVLTGTPVENSTFELWSQFAFLNPGLLGNLEYFKNEFGNPIERQGDENASQFLQKMVYPFILRRTKDQVAPELPPRTERIVYSDMEPAQRKFYDKTRDYYRAMLMGVIEEKGMNNARMQVLEGLLRLRQISNHPRLVQEGFRGPSAKFELLMDTLETLQAEGHKALIFSQFVQMLKIVRQEMDQREIPYVYLDGRTRKRQERVDTFQTDSSIPFFLISLKAGGVGLNLTAADYVIHIDPWWNPAVEMQATDRTHRIGQDKPVFVYKLITRNSVEEKILQLQEKKKALVEQLITTESGFFKNLTAEDVSVLFS